MSRGKARYLATPSALVNVLVQLARSPRGKDRVAARKLSELAEAFPAVSIDGTRWRVDPASVADAAADAEVAGLVQSWPERLQGVSVILSSYSAWAAGVELDDQSRCWRKRGAADVKPYKTRRQVLAGRQVGGLEDASWVEALPQLDRRGEPRVLLGQGWIWSRQEIETGVFHLISRALYFCPGCKSEPVREGEYCLICDRSYVHRRSRTRKIG